MWDARGRRRAILRFYVRLTHTALAQHTTHGNGRGPHTHAASPLLKRRGAGPLANSFHTSESSSSPTAPSRRSSSDISWRRRCTPPRSRLGDAGREKLPQRVDRRVRQLGVTAVFAEGAAAPSASRTRARALWEGAIGPRAGKAGWRAGEGGAHRTNASRASDARRKSAATHRGVYVAALVAKVAVLVARHPLRLHRLEQVEAIAARQPPHRRSSHAEWQPRRLRVEVELVLGEAAEELRALGRRKRGDTAHAAAVAARWSSVEEQHLSKDQAPRRASRAQL